MYSALVWYGDSFLTMSDLYYYNISRIFPKYFQLQTAIDVSGGIFLASDSTLEPTRTIKIIR